MNLSNMRAVAILLVALLGVCAPSAAAASTTPIGSSKISYSGSWKIAPSDASGQVNFELSHAMSNSGGDISLKRLGLPDGDLRGESHTIAFVVKTDAGSFVCRGSVSASSGTGTFDFVPDETYVKALNAILPAPLSPGQQVQAGMFDLNLTYVDAVAAAGFSRVPFETLLSFKMFKVSPEFLRTLHADFPTIDSSVVIGASMASDKEHVDLHALHLDFPDADFDTVIALAVAGVTPAYVAALRTAGVRGLTADVAGDLRAHGIDQSFADHLATSGPHGLSPDAVVRLKDGTP